MPLRVVRRPGRETLYLRGTVGGQSVYESAGTGDAGRAEQVRAKREAELWTASVYGARAVVTFATAAESYLRAESRSAGQRALVARLLLHFRTTPLAQIGQAQLDEAYRRLLRPGASPATKLRNVLTPLRAILEHAARRQWCDRPAFEVPRQPAPRVAVILPDQATALVRAARGHLPQLITFLIGTAARMSEALELDWRDVDLAGARVTFQRTKTGRERRADLAPTVRAALASLPHREGRVFRPVRQRRVRSDGRWVIQERLGEGYADNDRTSGGQIKTGWAAAWRRAGLPGSWREWTDGAGKQHRAFVPEMRPHDMRHVAASWHYAVHRDLLLLQQFGGWSNVAQVQVYAHVVPDAHRDAISAWLGLVPAAQERRA